VSKSDCTEKTTDGLNCEIKPVETVVTGLATHKNKNPQLYWTADESNSRALPVPANVFS